MDGRTAYMYKICVFFCSPKTEALLSQGRKGELDLIPDQSQQQKWRHAGLTEYSFLLTYNLPIPSRSDHPVVQTFSFLRFGLRYLPGGVALLTSLRPSFSYILLAYAFTTYAAHHGRF
jgi:hypothetical protein